MAYTILFIYYMNYYIAQSGYINADDAEKLHDVTTWTAQLKPKTNIIKQINQNE
jgi:hypothetical protein